MPVTLEPSIDSILMDNFHTVVFVSNSGMVLHIVGSS